MSMVVKNGLSQIDRINIILKHQNGILLTSDLDKINIPRTYLSILVQKGKIERISRGVYKMVSTIEDEMFGFQARYKCSFYSHETALYLHNLTDRTPLFYSLTVPVGYHSITLKESGEKIFYINRTLFDFGVISMKSPHGNEIKATNLERTICDVLRSRNQIDIQFVTEALKKYVVHQDRNIDHLYDYAKKFNIQKIVREYIEVLL